MNYINLPGMGEVSVFDICQAHCQLEADYNRGGIVWERPSNQRRNASTGVQLSRMRFDPGARWVDIVPTEPSDDSDDDVVRDIYLTNVLAWGLPIDAQMMAFIKERYTEDFLAQYPQCQGTDYKQGH